MVMLPETWPERKKEKKERERERERKKDEPWPCLKIKSIAWGLEILVN